MTMGFRIGFTLNKEPAAAVAAPTNMWYVWQDAEDKRYGSIAIYV